MGMFKDEDRLKTVYVGQVVIAPYANGADGAGIKCVVTSMTDSSAFVKNIKHKYVRWFAINELYPYDDRVKLARS